jgi:hypothetical protein
MEEQYKWSVVTAAVLELHSCFWMTDCLVSLLTDCGLLAGKLLLSIHWHVQADMGQ